VSDTFTLSPFWNSQPSVRPTELDPRHVAYYQAIEEAAQERAKAEAWRKDEADIGQASPADAPGQEYAWGNDNAHLPPDQRDTLRIMQAAGRLYPSAPGGSYYWPAGDADWGMHHDPGEHSIDPGGIPRFTSHVVDPITGQPITVRDSYDLTPPNPVWADVALSGLEGARQLGATVVGAPGSLQSAQAEGVRQGLGLIDQGAGTHLADSYDHLPWPLNSNVLPNRQDILNGMADAGLAYDPQTLGGQFARFGVENLGGAALGEGPFLERAAQVGLQTLGDVGVTHFVDPEDQDLARFGVGVITDHLPDMADRLASGGALRVNGGARSPLDTLDKVGDWSDAATDVMRRWPLSGGDIQSTSASSTPEIVGFARRGPPSPMPQTPVVAVQRAPSDPLAGIPPHALTWDRYPDAPDDEQAGPPFASPSFDGATQFAPAWFGGSTAASAQTDPNDVLSDPTIPRVTSFFDDAGNSY
jgi:hypothetical protein